MKQVKVEEKTMQRIFRMAKASPFSGPLASDDHNQSKAICIDLPPKIFLLSSLSLSLAQTRTLSLNLFLMQSFLLLPVLCAQCVDNVKLFWTWNSNTIVDGNFVKISASLVSMAIAWCPHAQNLAGSSEKTSVSNFQCLFQLGCHHSEALIAPYDQAFMSHWNCSGFSEAALKA